MDIVLFKTQPTRVVFKTVYVSFSRSVVVLRVDKYIFCIQLLQLKDFSVRRFAKAE